MTTATPDVAPASPKVDRLPPYAVLLHNDDKNEMGFVVQTIAQLARIPMHDAFERMLETHNQGQSVVLLSHREHAEFVCDCFRSKGLVATVERN